MDKSDVDYEEMAVTFDQVLPLIGPVAGRLVDSAQGLAPGVSVLDVACGTGEPGLTLLERHPDVRMLGVDVSESMVHIARGKAAARGFAAEYTVMDSRLLEVDDGSVDIVISRFGVLSFADPRAEARELSRVLRPGGSFSIAAWDAASKNVLTYAAMVAARAWLLPPVEVMLQQQERYAMPGRRAAWLRDAGLSEVHSELFPWQVELPDEPSLWALASGPAMLGSITGAITPAQLSEVRTTFGEVLSDYRRPDGSYVLPYACQVLRGTR